MLREAATLGAERRLGYNCPVLEEYFNQHVKSDHFRFYGDCIKAIGPWSEQQAGHIADQ